VPVGLEPGVEAMDRLFRCYGIGFTDVVKRPTAGGSELRAADYREWAPVLKSRLLEYAPGIAWFHGKQACANYLRCTGGRWSVIDWGEQAFRIGGSHVFMTPNPSPANAVYSLDNLTGWYRLLGELRERLSGSG